MAVRKFVSSGVGQNPLLTGVEGANDAAAADVLFAVATDSSAVTLDEFDEVGRELEETREQLEDQQQEARDATEEYEELRRRAEEEIVRLQEIEEQRLHDVAVQKALAAQRREREAEIAADAEAQRQSRRLAAAASSAAAGDAPSVEPTNGQTPLPTANASSGDRHVCSRPAVDPPAPPTLPPAPTGDGMSCPVAGSTAFADTWGAPRSGGRSHQGVDMMAAGGTPLVAVVSGSVNFKTTRLGGNSIWLSGNNGTKYFYAHLSAWEGSSRSVSQGETIGYVGRDRATPASTTSTSRSTPAVAQP